MSTYGHARRVRVDDKSRNPLVTCCRIGLEKAYKYACYRTVGDEGLGSV